MYVNYGDMKEMDTFYFIHKFQHAQEELLKSLNELTKTLLNTMQDIRFRYEGGIPPI